MRIYLLVYNGYLFLSPILHFILVIIILTSRFYYRGKYATVRRCRDKQTGKQYAAKYLRKRRRNADLRPEILHEVAVLEACTSNSRIVNLYKVFETSTEMILLLEL